jgi:ketosteroid isomerase-like protein
MSENIAIQFANEAFYEAFANADLAAMVEVWAPEGPLFCCHPGWPPLTSRDEVMASWGRILAAGGAMPIRCLSPEIGVFGGVGLVTCYESLGKHRFAVTNLFAKIGPRWRMIHHHAGPIAALPGGIEADEPAGSGPRSRH